MTLEELLKSIKLNWSTVLFPKSELSRWDKDFVRAFQGYSVFNLTDFNYGKCHTYEILAHRGSFVEPGSLEKDKKLIMLLGGQKYSILLKLSTVLPCYLIGFFCRKFESGEPIDRKLQPETLEHKALFQRAERFAQEKGYEPILEEFLGKPVPGASLELAEPGTVSVYNCLFEDHSNHSAASNHQA